MGKLHTMLGVLGVIVVYHLIASWWGWYIIYPWADIIAHTLGGAWIVLAAGYYMPRVWTLMRDHLGVWIMGAGMVAVAIVVGVGWEWFEYGVVLISGHATGMALSDTLGDLVCDTIGAVIAAGYLGLWGTKKG